MNYRFVIFQKDFGHNRHFKKISGNLTVQVISDGFGDEESALNRLKPQKNDYFFLQLMEINIRN